MAKATIIIEDIDLNAGTVRSNITVEETQIDDGQVTAAHFFAAFIKNGMTDPKFLADVWGYAEALMNSNPGGTLVNADQHPEVKAVQAA